MHFLVVVAIVALVTLVAFVVLFNGPNTSWTPDQVSGLVAVVVVTVVVVLVSYDGTAVVVVGMCHPHVDGTTDAIKNIHIHILMVAGGGLVAGRFAGRVAGRVAGLVAGRVAGRVAWRVGVGGIEIL